MEERTLQFRVGVVVIAAAIITIILVMVLGEGRRLFRQQYTIYLRFPQAPGVTVDTPVRKNGVLIGRVSNVQLRDEGGVELTAKIDQRYRLRRNEICRIATASLLGDAVLEFVPSGESELLERFDQNRDGRLSTDELNASREYYSDGDLTSEGIVASNPLAAIVNLEGDVRSAIVSIENAAQQVSTLARSVNDTIGGDGDQFQRLVRKSEMALDQFQRTMTSIDSVVSDQELKAGLKQALRDFPAAVGDARDTFAQARDAFAGMQRMSQRAEENLNNLKDFTGPLGERGEQLATNVERSMRNLDELLAQLLQFSESINQGEGSLSKFINDSDAYDRLNRAAANVEDASRRIRPILDDFRIFSDKIARDPRQLGVSGALDRAPSGTKIKTGVW